MDGNPVGTNKKQVFTFISPTKASVSTSIVAKPGMPSLWMDHLETEVVISGDKVTLTVDYSPSIIGLWQGHVTSDMGSEFDDGEEHRWEYLSDGSFHFYRLVDGEWQLSDDTYDNYFVDGTLLCTRWKNNGENTVENREWWEIASIEDGVMNWTALRQREDGTTYNATFSMTRVR